jgi:hypothetical protein
MDLAKMQQNGVRLLDVMLTSAGTAQIEGSLLAEYRAASVKRFPGAAKRRRPVVMKAEELRGYSPSAL